MYERFFGLTKAPFSLVPDPHCVHLTTQHADVISGLTFGILERKGCVVLTGEAGLGKTTSLRALSQLLIESNVVSSSIFAPTLTPSEFLELALLNFGLHDIPVSKAQRLKLLEAFLVQSDAEEKVLALIIDEAHQLSTELLEEVRLLGNFENFSHKLLQIVLVGQNELNNKLNLPQLSQLKQRVTVRLSLRPLDRPAVEEYIRFRWVKGGGSLPAPFSSGAIDAITAWSTGIARLINVICDNALMIAFSETRQTVDVQTVRSACDELSLPVQGIGLRSPSFVGTLPLQPSEPVMLHSGNQRDQEAPKNEWAAERPSLLKRWFRLTSSQQHQPTRFSSAILPLNEFDDLCTRRE